MLFRSTIYCGPNAPYILLPFLRKTNYKTADLVPVAPYGELVYAFGVLATRMIDETGMSRAFVYGCV